MELEYQFEPHDFHTVCRILRPVTRRSLLIVLAYIGGALGPTTTLLWYQGNLTVALPIFIAAFSAVIIAQLSAKRQMRRQFKVYCLKRVLRISESHFEAEWQNGWMRCDWSMFAEVKEYNGWLALRRVGTSQLGAILPPETVAQAQANYQTDLKAFIESSIAARRQTPQAIPIRDVGDQVIQEVEFELTPDEAAQVAERGFQARNAANTSPWSFCITMGVFVAVLTWLPMPSGIQTLAHHVLLPAMLLVLTMALLAPLKRYAYGKVLGDPALLQTQTTSVRDSGVEQRQARMQSLARWPLLATVVDAKRFVAVLTIHGGIICVPRRAFAGDDDLFLERIALGMRQQQERDQQRQSSEGELVETGNPYQPPAAM